MNSFIEDMNYYSDSRVIAQSKWYSHIDEKRMVATMTDDLRAILDDESIEYEGDEVQFSWDVCPTCGGKGSHVNPSIDSHGLTAEDFYDDPDFAEDYIRGHYDVACYNCGGRRVVPSISNPKIIKAIEEWSYYEAQSRSEYLAERRMGA